MYTFDVQGLQRRLTDLETALDTVTSRYPARVVLVPWREVVVMVREVHEDSKVGRWQFEVVQLRELIDQTRAELRQLREAESESD